MANIVLIDSEGKEQVYMGVTTLKMKTTDGGIASFVEQPVVYVSGEPIIIEIKATSWTHNEQTININSTSASNIQVGVPPDSTPSNAIAIVQSGLHLSYVSISSSSVSVNVAVTKIPIQDISIAIWGIK